MKKIMFLIFSFEGIENITSKIFNNNNEISIIGFIDKNISPEFKKYLTNIGFLGSKIIMDIEETIYNASLNSAKQKIALLIKNEKKVHKSNPKVNLIFNESLDELEKILDINEVDHLVVNLPKDNTNINESFNFSLIELKKVLKISFEIYYDGNP